MTTTLLTQIRSLVLGATLVLGGLTITRTSLFGYRVAGATLDAEEAAAALTHAPATPHGSLVRRAATAIRLAWRTGDGSPSYQLDPLAGGIERVVVRYAPSVRAPAVAMEEWMGRAQRALEQAGMVAGREGARLVVMGAVGRSGWRDRHMLDRSPSSGQGWWHRE